jgi:hypothetical protein
MTMKASQIANHAAGLLDGDRQKTHGDKRANFESMAAFWTTYLRQRFGCDITLTATDAALMMVQLKVVRTLGGAHNPDDYVDGVGYMAIAGELADEDDLSAALAASVRSMCSPRNATHSGDDNGKHL